MRAESGLSSPTVRAPAIHGRAYHAKDDETVTETMPRDAGSASSRTPMPALWWDEEMARLVMVDQTRLPGALVLLYPTTAGEIAEAIRGMRVRGAPAIGIAAAYGLAFGAREALAGVVEPGEAMERLAVRGCGATRHAANSGEPGLGARSLAGGRGARASGRRAGRGAAHAAAGGGARRWPLKTRRPARRWGASARS